MIVDGRVLVTQSPVASDSDLGAYLSACYPKAKIPPMSWRAPSARPMVARVNHGIWIASCECGATGLPSPGCVVFLDAPWGWCVRCGNRFHGGFWRPVVIPDADTRRLIEAVLLCRQNPDNRNWLPDESVEMLMVENALHGEPVPDLDLIRIGPIHGPSVNDLVTPFPAETMRSVLSQGSTRGRLRRLIGR